MRRATQQGWRRVRCAAFLALIALECPVMTRAGEPSAEYQAGIRRAAERRKQRRQRRAAQPVGMIVPYPMPPALIIKQTPQVHEEIDGLLRLLRGQP